MLSTTRRIIIFFGAASNSLFRSPFYNFPFNLYYNRMPSIATGDLNSDGFIDLLVIRASCGIFSEREISIFLNMGDGYSFKCTRERLPSVRNAIISIIIYDSDNDGRQNDLGFVDGYGDVHTYIVNTQNSLLSYSFTTLNLMYRNPSNMVKGKFNDDKFDDLALISSQSDTLQVLLRYKDPQLGLEFVQMIYLTDHYPVSLARINFNNDLIDDLAILNCNGTMTVFIGTKIGLFDRKYLSFGTSVGCGSKCCQSLKVADLNQDGKDDLVFIDTEMNRIRVVLGSPCNE